MKTYVFSLSFLLLFLNCEEDPNWKIEFCTEIENGHCANAKDTFERNQRIFVTLESKKPISEKMIVGTIHRMLNGNYDDYLGSNNFEIEPKTYKLEHYIPFDELGGAGPHLIEFTTEEGKVLVSKELFIK